MDLNVKIKTNMHSTHAIIRSAKLTKNFEIMANYLEKTHYLRNVRIAIQQKKIGNQ